jgi:hypothetical protein
MLGFELFKGISRSRGATAQGSESHLSLDVEVELISTDSTPDSHDTAPKHGVLLSVWVAPVRPGTLVAAASSLDGTSRLLGGARAGCGQTPRAAGRHAQPSQVAEVPWPPGVGDGAAALRGQPAGRRYSPRIIVRWWWNEVGTLGWICRP